MKWLGKSRGFNLASAAIVALIVTGAGCSTPEPIRYYTLQSASVPATASSPSAGAASYVIDVQPVVIPAQVDQMTVVIRQSDGQLAMSDNHLWIAPLGNEFRDALATQLSARLAVPDLHGTPAPSNLPVWRIAVEIQHFDSELNHQAILEARWSLRKATENAPALVCVSQIREPVGAGWPALIQGHQQGIAVLADKIAHTLTSLTGVSADGHTNGHPAPCAG